MESSVKLIVYRSTIIYDSVIVAPSGLVRYQENTVKENLQKQENLNSNDPTENSQKNFLSLNRKGLNAYLVSAYIVTISESDIYRKAALNKLLKFLFHHKSAIRENTNIILIKLRTPKKQFLDYYWNEKLTHMVMERREVDHAMSWLSTLGGAFSALGEEIVYCAEMAGKISVKQFELALRLGDPLLVARCKLYAALSMIQRGNYRIPKEIVKKVYLLAITQNDLRLKNMCQGIWAKLMYCYKERRERRKKSKRNICL